jgi:hypothetical protein
MIKSRLFALLLCVASLGGASIASAQDACDATTITGNYGYSLNGYVYDQQGYTYYLTAVGVASGDGAGNLSGSETMSFDGKIVKHKFTGTYTVNSDCTGSATFNYADNVVIHFDLVILNDAKEINLVQTDSGWIYSGTLKKQKTATPAPAPATSTGSGS